MLDDAAARCAVTAERALLAALEAGCTAPVGALATVTAEGLSLEGVAAATDGSVVLRRHLTGSLDDPAALGRELAALLLADGAAGLVDRLDPGARLASTDSTPSALSTPSRPFQPSPERAP